MNITQELDLFGNLITKPQQTLTKKELRRIERAKLKKLGEANYFYRTTGKNCYHTDGFTLGVNGITKIGGYTVFLNGKHLVTERLRKNTAFTNNEAELLGVLEALKDCENGDEVITDSMNTLSWIRSGNPKSRPDLKNEASECKRLLHLKKVNVYWLGRDYNLAGNYNEFELQV